MTHFGVVTMPLLYTCESGDNYYLVFETSVLISSNIPFLDNAHPHNWALWSRSNLRKKQHPYYKYSNRHPHCWGWGFNDVNYPQSPFVCKISCYFCLTCEQALAFIFSLWWHSHLIIPLTATYRKSSWNFSAVGCPLSNPPSPSRILSIWQDPFLSILLDQNLSMDSAIRFYFGYLAFHV